ncbi:hypothetical protein ACE6H2_024541 [Prunus campanulata]
MYRAKDEAESVLLDLRLLLMHHLSLSGDCFLPKWAGPCIIDGSSVLIAHSSVHWALVTEIFEYNGSALIAMVGKNCFAIASDRKLVVQLQTIATDFQRIHRVHDRLFIGLSGLATDA